MPVRSPRRNINITEHLEQLIADLCMRVPVFAHINPRRVLVCLTKARRRSAGGTFAKIVPTRFPNGSPFKQVDGYCYALPQIPTHDGDVLYLIYIYTPRFFQQPFERRLLTVIHELYHIAPAFDGTIRRIGSRAHGASRESFNGNLQPLVDGYLASQPSDESLFLLRSDFASLAREAALIGRAMPLPKAVRLG